MQETSNKRQKKSHVEVDNLESYRVGSILRMKLKKFVTYDLCEFTPGPNMNMIIGANGSGKSTIIAGMALGLGGSPHLLGRAKEISEYVKFGAEKASIEITLRAPADSDTPTWTIRRQFKRESNTSEWSINGQSTSQKEVLARIKQLDIQVENLCQFLPQDRVCEFAQLSSEQLLIETQKAAGAPELLARHQKLIQMQEDEESKCKALIDMEQDLKRLESLTKDEERHVARYKEKRTLEEKLTQFNRLKPTLLYERQRAVYIELRDKKKEAKARLKEEEAVSAPLIAELKHWEAAVKVADTTTNSLRSKLTSEETKVAQAKENILESEREMEELKEKFIKREKIQQQRTEQIVALEKEIAELEKILHQAPPSEADAQQVRDQLRRNTEAMNKLIAEREQVQVEVRRIETEGRSLQLETNQIMNQIRDLDSHRERALERMQQLDHQTVQAFQWLEKNRQLCKMHIFGPVLLDVTLTRPDFASQFEACLNPQVLTTFVCQTNEDYDLLALHPDFKRLNLHFSHQNQEVYHSPLSSEQLQQLGFECFAVDVFQAPDPVRRFLCQRSHLHQVPLTRQRLKDPGVVERVQELSRFVASDVSYETRRIDGRVSTMTRRVNPARFFSLQDADTAEQRSQYQSRMDQLQQKNKQNQQQMRQCIAKVDALTPQLDQYRTEQDKLKDALDGIIRAIQQHRQRRQQVRNKQAEVAKLRSTDGFKQDLQELRLEMTNNAKKRWPMVKSLQNLLNECVNVAEKLAQSEWLLIHVTAERDLVSQQILVNNTKYEELTNAYEMICKKFEEAHDRMQQLLEEHQKIAPSTEELEKFMSQYPDSVETIEQLIDECRAQLDVIGQTMTLKAMQDYESRVKEMNELRERVQEQQKVIEKLRQLLLAERDLWLPSLTTLVEQIDAQFGEFFKKLACSGEVGIKQQPKYKDWGLDLRVRFREQEQLQTLTAHRQSGGERAVSTILYLLSLQHLSRSPFRVVDEINQGMDTKNERMVHEIMVQTATQANTSQYKYFLITPKLLPGLTYNEKIHVLCVYNGVWLPPFVKTWDPLAFFEKKRQAALVAG